MSLGVGKSASPLPVQPAHILVPVPTGPPPLPPPASPRRPVRVTIDGREVLVPEGSTLLQLRARPALIPQLFASGNAHAGQCLPHLRCGGGGSRTLVPACSRKAEDGMVVRTNTERVRLSRRLILEIPCLLCRCLDITPDSGVNRPLRSPSRTVWTAAASLLPSGRGGGGFPCPLGCSPGCHSLSAGQNR